MKSYFRFILVYTVKIFYLFFVVGVFKHSILLILFLCSRSECPDTETKNRSDFVWQTYTYNVHIMWDQEPRNKYTVGDREELRVPWVSALVDRLPPLKLFPLFFPRSYNNICMCICARAWFVYVYTYVQLYRKREGGEFEREPVFSDLPLHPLSVFMIGVNTRP